jgi:hypothetical protein
MRGSLSEGSPGKKARPYLKEQQSLVVHTYNYKAGAEVED